MQISEKFNNKKIAVLGAFGIEGLATQEYLKSHGLDFETLDKQTDADYLARAQDFDIVFRTPGISPLLPEIVAAKKEGTAFTSQIEEFFEICPCKIIGVTGTKGKGTTSTLIYDILQAEGVDVYLGGNIGIPAIAFVEELTEDSVVVLELSSFQLQTLQKSPHIAVVLNVTSEHLDYHKDISEYREAKSNIVAHQMDGDMAVINDDYEVSRSFASKTVATKYFFSRDHKVKGCFVDKEDNIVLNVQGEYEKLASVTDLLLRGRHNLENVTAASLAAYLAGTNTATISRAIKGFRGLEHRLELVRELEGVKYYNDSFSTVPETAIAALNSFTEPIILIAGGSDKKSDYTALGDNIADSNVKAIFLMGEMASNIQQAIPKSFTGQTVMGLTNISEVVEKAKYIATKGDVVLLSPACASFGLFENYKDRGDQFKDAVKRL